MRRWVVSGYGSLHCEALIGAERLARDDDCRQARRRYRWRGEADGPADLPPVICLLPTEPRFDLREARPHWCYPDRDAWCRVHSVSAPSPTVGTIDEAALS